jgi:hypothetical protein
MTGFNCIFRGLGVGVLTLAGVSTHAQEAANSAANTTSGATLRFEGKAGAEYNSNIAVADIDANTGEGDWAATINLLAEATLIPVSKLTLRGGYDFSQSLHDEFDAFDLAIHRGYAEIAYDFDVVTAGVLGNLAQASLDGDEYLTYSQVSPYLSRQFGKTLFLRAAYAATEKEFSGRPERDATSDAVSVDAYVFLDGVKRYLVLGGKATEEDANAAEFDYNAGAAKARLVQRFDAMGREMTFRAGAEYEQRDYDNVTPLIGVAREDKRTTLDLSLEAPLGKRFFVEGSYRYGNYSSNLASADFDEHVGAIKVGVKY